MRETCKNHSNLPFILFITIMLACIFLVSYFVQTWQHTKQDEFSKTSYGKNIITKMHRYPHGLVYLDKENRIALLDQTDADKTKFQRTYRNTEQDTWEDWWIAKCSNDIYSTNEDPIRRKERAYLLEIFAQGKELAPDWKNHVQ